MDVTLQMDSLHSHCLIYIALSLSLSLSTGYLENFVIGYIQFNLTNIILFDKCWLLLPAANISCHSNTQRLQVCVPLTTRTVCQSSCSISFPSTDSGFRNTVTAGDRPRASWRGKEFDDSGLQSAPYQCNLTDRYDHARKSFLTATFPGSCGS